LLFINKSDAFLIEATLKHSVGKPVILSAAKNLKLTQSFREILRYAQDDRKPVLRWILVVYSQEP